MPEGPEIRRAADRVHKAIAGHRAENVYFHHEHLRRFEETLTGRSVQEVTSRGKAMLTVFDGDLVVYSHNQLYGTWRTARPGARPNTRRSLRLAIDTENRSALLYSASEIEVLERADLDGHHFLSRLGPDALDASVSAAEIDERLASKAFRRRSVAALLLDQGFVAGLGNYLRSDILFDARVSPRTRPADLDDATRGALAASILTVTRRAYRHNSVTNEPERAKAMRAAGMRRREYRHLAYSRTGKPCFRCDTPIVREDISGRGLYFCPACQFMP